MESCLRSVLFLLFSKWELKLVELLLNGLKVTHLKLIVSLAECLLSCMKCQKGVRSLSFPKKRWLLERER